LIPARQSAGRPLERLSPLAVSPESRCGTAKPLRMELEMAGQNVVDKVWAMMEKITICMLTTYDGKELRSRPMGAYLRREEGKIFFLADAAHHKDEQIREYPHVNCAFADAGAQKYVSLTGTAR
jgi:hypothetical protein